MSRGQKTLGGLLAAVVVLLGVNLMVETARPAAGQPSDQEHPLPVAVAVSPVETTSPGATRYRVFRLWGDGTVDQTRVSFDTSASCKFDTCGPVQVVSGPRPGRRDQ